MHQNKRALYYNRLISDGIQAMVNKYVDSVVNTSFCAFDLLEQFFASGSTTGLLNIWDVSQLAMISQIKIHNSRINRLQFHPTSKSKQNCTLHFTDWSLRCFRSKITTDSISRWICQGNNELVEVAFP